MKRVLIAIVLSAATLGAFAQPGAKAHIEKPFVHPGIAQTRQDLDFLKKEVLKGEQPYKDSFERLKAATKLNFKPEPFAHVSVGPYGANSQGGSEIFASSEQAYNNAMMWYITGNKAYADKAIEILNAWSKTLWDFDENNAKLNVGLTTYGFVNAAEILKNTNSGWQQKDIDQFKRMLLGPCYQTIKDFFTEANGNWDGSLINSMLGIGIFTDNHEIFNRAIDRFYHGPNNGSIIKYVYPSGQIQETTRDWGHVQLGIGEFEKAAQIAWTQGIDLYSAGGNRLALAYEYTSKFMLGEDVPVYGLISQRERGRYRDIYESIYQHYHAKGIEMPYTARVIKEHTGPKSAIMFLSSVRAPLAAAPKITTVLTAPASVILTAGALLSPTVTPPANSVIVAPGDSIQAALDANAGKGKWVVLAKGIHVIKVPLRIPSGITLAGQGNGSVLMLSPKASGLTVVNADKDMHDITIRDLLVEGGLVTGAEFDPNAARMGRALINAPRRGGILFSADRDNQMSNIRFEHVSVINCTKNGVSVRGAKDVIISDCNFSDNGGNGVPGGGLMHNLHITHSSNIQVTNSRFDTSPWGSGIDLSYSNNAVITNNETERNKLSGISCTESNNVKLTGNLIEGNDENGIRFDTLFDSFNNITITNNTVQYNTAQGIYVLKMLNSNVANNKLVGNGK